MEDGIPWLLVVAGVFWLAMTGLGAWLSAQKGRAPSEGATLGFLFGPLGVIVAGLVPNATWDRPIAPDRHEEEDDDDDEEPSAPRRPSSHFRKDGHICWTCRCGMHLDAPEEAAGLIKVCSHCKVRTRIPA